MWIFLGLERHPKAVECVTAGEKWCLCGNGRCSCHELVTALIFGSLWLYPHLAQIRARHLVAESRTDL